VNVYPRDVEPTVTPPSNGGARGEREASYFASALWGPGRACPDRLAIKKPPAGDARDRSVTLGQPIEPPDIYDRELDKVLAAPTHLATIGRWHRRARTVTR